MKKSIAYELCQNKVLGIGSTSRVVEAISIENSEKVACKIISKHSLRDFKADQLLQREIALMKHLSKINHPNIVTARAVAEDAQYVYIFMDLVQGFDLCALLEKYVNRGMSEREAQFYFRQMVDALVHCHSQGVAHRDVKLENFMVDVNTKTLKLCDFGLGDFLFADRKSVDETECNERRLFREFCGSPMYAAPTLVSQKPFDGKAVDVWSLGIVLYCLVVGWFPFYSKQKFNLFQKIREKPLKFDKLSNRQLSPELKSLIEKMLKKDPKQRITLEQIKREDKWFHKDLGNPPRPESRMITCHSPSTISFMNAIAKALSILQSTNRASSSTFQKTRKCRPVPSTPPPSPQRTVIQL